VAPPWHDDDALWQELAPVFFTARRRAAAPVEVEQLLRLVGARAGTRVLDLCCGPGRHAIELAARGHLVTGVDRTQRYLEEARAEAERRAVSVEWVEEDMRRFVRPGAFDLAVNLYTSFGYFEDPLDDQRVLEHLRESLVRGGALVLEMVGREVLARRWRARDWEESAAGLLLEERKLEDDWAWIETRFVLWSGTAGAAGAERSEHRIRHRLFSGSELKAQLLAAGFEEVRLFGDFDGSPYGLDAARLVAVARR
jgi:SAM-dependent methyltransferase